MSKASVKKIDGSQSRPCPSGTGFLKQALKIVLLQRSGAMSPQWTFSGGSQTRAGLRPAAKQLQQGLDLFLRGRGNKLATDDPSPFVFGRRMNHAGQKR